MWALVKASQVIEIIGSPKSITVGEVRHPKDIFTHWSSSDLKAIGVYEFISGSTPDDKFETATTTSYKVDDSKGTVTETINKKDKDLDDLKKTYTAQIQKQATALLTPTDWMIVRKAEVSSKSIASDVTTFRASVRTKSDEIVTAISNCDTLDKLKALFVTEYNEDKSVKTKATMDTLPDDEDIKGYKR
jgi:hypothetical protein